MRYRPLEISTQLCYLFDSRKCSVDEFAETLHLDPRYVERLARDSKAAIDGAVRLDIVRLLRNYHRQYPETKPPSEYEMARRQLKLVEEADSTERKGTPRGVFEDSNPPYGTRIFKSIDDRGICREQRLYMASDVSRQVERRILLGMELYLDAVNPMTESVTGDT